MNVGFHHFGLGSLQLQRNLDKNAFNFVHDIFSQTCTTSLDKPTKSNRTQYRSQLASPWNIRQGHGKWASDYIASRRRIVAEAPQGAAAFECARASPDGGSAALLMSRLCKVSNAALFPLRRRIPEDFGSGAKLAVRKQRWNQHTDHTHHLYHEAALLPRTMKCCTTVPFEMI
ncbi:hypothetical protein Q1695_010415 [Nippostrongylus brasiliensis]|nr:hypothetical protein Q1695_010415 [Nippostrongylus brasiliensis]